MKRKASKAEPKEKEDEKKEAAMATRGLHEKKECSDS